LYEFKISINFIYYFYLIIMAINQLFKIKPSYEILVKICFLYDIDLNNLEKKNTFTKLELIELQIDNYFEMFKNLLSEYYLPCKSKKYLECIDIKKSITILRQLLKLYNFSLLSSERYNNSKKYIIYTIKYNKIENKETIDGIISFD